MKSAASVAKQVPLVLDTQEVYYPIALDLEYYVLDHGCIVAAGTGKTTNISRKTIVFECDARLPSGTILQIIARWPVLYQGKETLKWIVQGRVTASTAGGIVLAIEHERLVRPSHDESAAEDRKDTSAAPRLSEKKGANRSWN